MWLLIIVLNQEKFLDDLLSVLVELGITDAAIIDSQAMGKALAYEVPIFAGLSFQMSGSKSYSKTIIAQVERKEIGSEIMKMLQDVDIDFLTPGVGRIFILKLEEALGTPVDLDLA